VNSEELRGNGKRVGRYLKDERKPVQEFYISRLELIEGRKVQRNHRRKKRQLEKKRYDRNYNIGTINHCSWCLIVYGCRVVSLVQILDNRWFSTFGCPVSQGQAQ
jgi:hypothetical protein